MKTKKLATVTVLAQVMSIVSAGNGYRWRRCGKKVWTCAKMCGYLRPKPIAKIIVNRSGTETPIDVPEPFKTHRSGTKMAVAMPGIVAQISIKTGEFRPDMQVEKASQTAKRKGLELISD